MESKVILVTGGFGYIGSHTVVELCDAGYEVVVVDNLYNSSEEIHKPLETLTGKKIKYYIVDLLDEVGLEKVFKENKFYATVHFAAKKAVGESVKEPIGYYKNNVTGSINLIEMCHKYNVDRFIFSSSACVYGNNSNPKEDDQLGAINPYGWSKIMIERVLIDTCNSNKFSGKNFRSIVLRYCNPVSAHKSGLIGESPKIAPSNLFPVIENHLRGKSEKLYIFGKDYNTHDGTAIRDYVHVVDIAKGHVSAISWFTDTTSDKSYEIYNMGTDTGYSVLDVVTTYTKANDITINWEYAERRQGDAEKLLPNNSKIKKELGWSADISLTDMCRDSYNWVLKTK
jgi:UDP-glucose 4-epimerase